MPKASRQFERLEWELLGLGEKAMLLEELDGFVAGVIVCPDLMKRSEWLPFVWGTEGGEAPRSTASII